MAKKKKARSGGQKANVKRGNPRVLFLAPKASNGRKKRRSSNPAFFGANVTPVQVGEYVLGGLVGVTVNRVVLPLLPAPLIQSNIAATISAFGLAALEWWAASFINKNFGAAVGFGALMNAASQGLNAFVPQVGSTIGLSGYRRGTGDMVPARFAVPQNPILDASVPNNGVAMRSAYPPAYGQAA